MLLVLIIQPRFHSSTFTHGNWLSCLGKVLGEAFLDLCFPFHVIGGIKHLWQYGPLRLAMEEPHSVSSPRRILSLSRKKRPGVSFSDSEDKASGFGVSGEHGPKTSEVYGFVGSITTIAATVIFLAWAYVPESWLHTIGIFYYPSRYWALAFPVYVMVTILLALGFYIGLNFMSTPPPTSVNTLFDEFSREPMGFSLLADGDELPIEPISDIGIDEMNRRMFGSIN